MTKIEILHDTTFTPDGTGIIRYTVDGKPVEAQPLPCFFSGYKYFNPIQTVFAMYYSGGSCLISAPTSAGKTLTGAQFCKKVLTSGCNVIYTAPTQALAREIYTKLKELFSRVYLKLTGYDEEDVRLPSSEAIIVTTYEAVQLGLRNKVSWARNLGGIIIDEFHQILSSRGDIIEEIVAVALLQGTSMLCLSATLPEPYKVAKWIGVNLFIYSNWRPVPLERIIVDEDLHQIVTHYAMDNAKTIVFVGTKSKGWNVLKMLHRHGYRIINETVPFEKDDHPESTLPFIAFHCADVPLEEQVTIEKKFKTASDFNLLVATHTLAYGVNLPADRVVIAVTKGRDFWPNLIDVLQMEGRAGRLGLKEKGQSIIVPVSADSTRRSKMLNRLNRDLDGCLSTGFIPSLKKKLLEGKNGIEDILHVFLVPFAYFNDKSKHKALIDKFYSLSDVVKNLYSVIVGDLTRKGYLCDGKLTAKGLFTVKAGLSIEQTEEFLRRAAIKMYPAVDGVALVRDPIGIENSFIKGDDIGKVEVTFFSLGILQKIEDLIFMYSDLGEANRDSIRDFLYWINGFFYFLKHLHKVPGSIARSFMEYRSILRGMLTAQKLGLVDYSYEELYLTGCSIKKGLPMEYCLLSSIPGISYMRGHALVLALKAINAPAPVLKQSVVEYVESYCESKEFDDILKEVLSYRHETVKDLDREFKKIKEKLRSVKDLNLIFEDKAVESIINYYQPVGGMLKSEAYSKTSIIVS